MKAYDEGTRILTPNGWATITKTVYTARPFYHARYDEPQSYDALHGIAHYDRIVLHENILRIEPQQVTA